MGPERIPGTLKVLHMCGLTAVMVGEHWALPLLGEGGVVWFDMVRKEGRSGGGRGSYVSGVINQQAER